MHTVYIRPGTHHCLQWVLEDPKQHRQPRQESEIRRASRISEQDEKSDKRPVPSARCSRHCPRDALVQERLRSTAVAGREGRLLSHGTAMCAALEPVTACRRRTRNLPFASRDPARPCPRDRTLRDAMIKTPQADSGAPGRSASTHGDALPPSEIITSHAFKLEGPSGAEQSDNPRSPVELLSLVQQRANILEELRVCSPAPRSTSSQVLMHPTWEAARSAVSPLRCGAVRFATWTCRERPTD